MKARLFRCNGSLIPPDVTFSTQFGEKVWTWKSYWDTVSRCSSQLKFGVGYVMDANIELPPSPKRLRTEDDVVIGGDNVSVLYCGEIGGQGLDTDHLLDRRKVYNTCIEFTEQSSHGMDSPVPFFPEENDYKLAKVCIGLRCILSVDSNGQYTVNGDSDSGLFCVVHQSPQKVTLPVKDTIPLYCIVSKHGLDDVYHWKRGLHDQQANTPVLWINLPGVYSCSVTRESRVCKSNAISVEWKRVHQSDTPVLSTDVDDEETSIRDDDTTKSPSSVIGVSSNKSERGDDDNTSSFIGGSTMVYSHDALKKASNSFPPESLIGKGGFGSVYKGNLRKCTVAIKVLTERGIKMLRATTKCLMKNEVDALSRFRHPNILPLMGYCLEPRCLVFPFMNRLSLYTNLHEFKAIKKQQALTWCQRVSVLCDASCGLAYLHSESPPVLHHDVNASNILLDDKLSAKISDFGFSIQLPQSVNRTTLITATDFLPGTHGYRPPEFSDCKYSVKSDVYSFGVVILETFTGLLAFSDDRDASNLVDHVEDECRDVSYFKGISDKKAMECTEDVLMVFFQTVKMCVSRIPKKRASINTVYDQFRDTLTSMTNSPA